MKYSFLILSILICFPVLSQDTQTISGTVTYRFTPNNYMDTIPKKHATVFREMYKNTEDIRFILTFNNNVSLFETQEEMSSDFNAMSFSVAKRMVAKGSYYTDLSKFLIIRKVETGGEDILVSIKLDKETPWKITKETKYINNLKCYKATKMESITNSKGTFNFQIVAWFAPEIPAKFGPKDFNNLPGLILELQDTHHTFYVEDIKVSTKKASKIYPFKGKIITEKEYLKITRKSLSNYKQSLKQN